MLPLSSKAGEASPDMCAAAVGPPGAEWTHGLIYGRLLEWNLFFLLFRGSASLESPSLEPSTLGWALPSFLDYRWTSFSTAPSAHLLGT